MQRCLLRNHRGIPYSTNRTHKLAISTAKRANQLLTDGLIDDVANLLDLLFGKFTSTLGRVNLGNAEGENSEAAAETSDDAEAESSLLLAVDVGVLHTQNVLEILGVFEDESRLCEARECTIRTVYFTDFKARFG